MLRPQKDTSYYYVCVINKTPQEDATRPRHSKDASKSMLTKTCVTQDAHKKTPIRRYKASVPNATTSLIIINLTHYHYVRSY